MMRLLPEEEFYKHILKEHRRRMKKIRAGEYISTENLDKALKEI